MRGNSRYVRLTSRRKSAIGPTVRGERHHIPNYGDVTLDPRAFVAWEETASGLQLEIVQVLYPSIRFFLPLLTLPTSHRPAADQPFMVSNCIQCLLDLCGKLDKSKLTAQPACFQPGLQCPLGDTCRSRGLLFPRQSFGAKRDCSMAGCFFPLPKVLADGVQIIVELLCVSLTGATYFFHNRVFHCSKLSYL